MNAVIKGNVTPSGFGLFFLAVPGNNNATPSGFKTIGEPQRGEITITCLKRIGMESSILPDYQAWPLTTTLNGEKDAEAPS